MRRHGGMYVDESEYGYYFRQGFQRGYEDGYSSRFQYGSNANGTLGILANVLSAIFRVGPSSQATGAPSDYALRLLVEPHRKGDATAVPNWQPAGSVRTA